MKIAYRDDPHLSKKNIELLQIINEIIDDYAADNFKLTLRELYYELVGKVIIPNVQAEYSKLSRLLTKGRMAGLVNWDAIEDRLRKPDLLYWVIDIPDALQDTIDQYRLNRQRGQKNYLEIWTEKDALSGILQRLAHHYHIRLVVNRGYSSCTAMHEAFKRLGRAEENEQKLIILYVGDHDPSGLDMLRDIPSRLEEFGVSCKLIPVALTQKQIQQYSLPKNTAKVTDPRAQWYIENFGDKSWEVDALGPRRLTQIVEKAIKKHVNIKLFEQTVAQEEAEIKELRKIIKEKQV